MFADTIKLLTRIKDATNEAMDAVHFCAANEAEWIRMKAIMYQNLVAQNLLNHSNVGSADWQNEVVKFFSKEFFLDFDSNGHKKYEHFRISSCQTRNTIVAALAKTKFRGFVELMEQFKLDWRPKHSCIPNTFLVVTAIPVEFRAMLRRLSGIVNIRMKSNDSPDAYFDSSSNLLRATSIEKAMDWVFNKDLDKMEVDGKEKERPFFIAVQGIVGSIPGKCASVTVALPPAYGLNHARTAIDWIGNDLSIKFAEALVVGVAGRLDSNLKFGDLVISNRIFDATTNKQKDSGTSFPKAEPWIYLDNATYPDKTWKPVLQEDLPNSAVASERGFEKWLPGPVVSGSSLSKGEAFKSHVIRAFPSGTIYEMEAIGCCYVLGRDTSVRVIKSPCDNSDGTKDKVWQPYCADVAASFATDYILMNTTLEDQSD